MNISKNNVVDKKITGVCFFGIQSGNHQGGAEIENNPRVDITTGRACVNNSGINRKMRDTLKSEGHEIFVSRGSRLDRTYAEDVASMGFKVEPVKDDEPTSSEDTEIEVEAEEDVEVVEVEAEKKGKGGSKKGGGKKGGKIQERPSIATTQEEKQRIIAHMCDKYIDARWFGQVFPKPVDMGLMGPVRTGWAWSVEPVELIEYTPTRVAGIGKEKGMGRSQVVRHALFRLPISIEPTQARITGFTWEDFDLLKKVMSSMFERTNSATRQLTMEKMVWFTHASGLGSYPQHKLQRRVKCEVKTVKGEDGKSVKIVPSSVNDYIITIDREGLPKDITIEEMD